MDENLRQAQEALITAFGRQSTFWGLGKIAGEMYAVLYLSREPVCLEEIAERLSVTKGNISIAIRQLEQLGLARRSWQRGDRRVFFEAETDFWKIAHSVLSLRHKPEFDQTFALVRQSTGLAIAGMPSKEKEYVMERLDTLQEFYRLLDSVVEAALAMTPEQMKGIVEMFNMIRPQIGHQP